jgi:DEAD/DEAH box helicase domain-containing protein
VVRRFRARPPSLVPIPEGVDPRLVDALRVRGIEALYSHQARTRALLDKGGHVVVVTPTASGKTLCYNLPVLEALVRDPAARALYLFPTKALAQDQLAELEAIARALPELRIHTYDGDTPQDARRAVRARANLVLTNPDMLHSGILPHHTKWAVLFQNLRYVVIDELHAYRGVFGSHLSNVLRRLRRICAHYGSTPQFIMASATIANPGELASRLSGEPTRPSSATTRPS